MKYVCFLAISIYLFFLAGKISYAAQGTPATPTSIALFSNQAIITVEENALPQDLPEGGKAFIIQLPASADPSSLHVTVKGINATSVIWAEEKDTFFSESTGMSSEPNEFAVGYSPIKETTKSNSSIQKNIESLAIPQTLLPQEEKDPYRKKLLEDYNLRTKEASTIQGRVNVAKATIKLWETAFTATQTNVDNITKVESLINDRVSRATESLHNDLALLQDVQRKVNNTLKDIAIYDTNHRVRTAYIVAGKNTTPGATSLHYTYTMKAKSTPSYRVNAIPANNNISIDQIADITFQVPSIWKNVETSLVFRDFNASSYLDFPSPWILNYRDENSSYARPLIRSASKSMVGTQQEGIVLSSVMATADNSPIQQEMSTFRIWKLGKQTFTPNQRLQTILSSATYKADFYYAIRPSVRNEAYLFANIQFESPVEMPYGNATYSIDSVYAGDQNIAFSGNKGLIQLGDDPQVKVHVKDLEKKRGSQGFISKEQTGIWRWEISVTNFRNRAITAHIEEPAPISLDQTIKVTTTANPEPVLVSPSEPNADSALKLLVWEKELKPQENFIINYNVQAVFTKDKALSSNR